MLDIKYIRENSGLVKKALKDKQLEGTVDIDKLLEIDTKYKNILQLVETKRALKNQLSEDISKFESSCFNSLIAFKRLMACGLWTLYVRSNFISIAANSFKSSLS